MGRAAGRAKGAAYTGAARPAPCGGGPGGSGARQLPATAFASSGVSCAVAQGAFSASG